jgi:hypothetical protein
VWERSQRTDGLGTLKAPGNQAVIGGKMQVRLKQEWMGHHVGAIVKVSESSADILFQRDAAEIMEPESIEKIKEKLQNMVAENLFLSKSTK